MYVMNSYAPDGIDVSWIWDADFEQVAEFEGLKRFYCVGTRAEDVATRVKYAGIPTDKISVYPAKDRWDIKQAIEDIVNEDVNAFITTSFTALPETRRLYRPEDSRRGVTAKTKYIRGEAGFSIPSCPTTGYRYSRLGYGTVVEAAMPPLEAKHTHEEIAITPNIDIPALPLFGNNWFCMEYAKENNLEDMAAYVSAMLKITKGYGIKIVNPCGSEAWGCRCRGNGKVVQHAEVVTCYVRQIVVVVGVRYVVIGVVGG